MSEGSSDDTPEVVERNVNFVRRMAGCPITSAHASA